MPETAIEQALSRATADVLEQMFFTGVAAESAGFQNIGPRIAVRLAFAGERPGVLALSISSGAARTLAADFLGTDSEDGPDAGQVNEVVQELANMICGDALSTLAQGALGLSPPEIVPAADFVPAAGGSHRSFDLGNGTLMVALAFADGEDA